MRRGIRAGDVGDLVGGGVWSFAVVAAGDPDAAGGVERDAPVFDRFAQDEGQHGEDVGGGAGCQLGGEVQDEGFDVLAADPGQG